MINSLISYQARNLDYAKRLTADLADNQWCLQPGTVRNHATWVIGHIAWVADKVTGARILGLPSKIDSSWDVLFNNKSQPTGDALAYPGKTALMAAYEDAVQRIAAALKQKPDTLLAQPTSDEGFAKRYPLMGDALLHLMAGHDAIHLGQLSAWRRAQGLPAV
jgi:hypothetical protein